ncbi:MAG: hypothetical protein ACLQVX_12780 [Limisphaerales bacterium]
MNLTQLIAPALIIASLTTSSRTAAAAEPPTVDSILARVIEATGGREAMQKVHSRVMRFKLESETFGNVNGEAFAAVPNKMRSHVDLGAPGAIDNGFDGTVAWGKSPWEGLRVKSGGEMEKVRRDAEFNQFLNLKALCPGLAYKGTEKVGEEEAYVLESKPSASSKEKFWFGAKSGLLIRQESEFEGPQGVVNVSLLNQDYKTFDGLKYPGLVKLSFSAGGQSIGFTMRFSDVKHNVQIEAAKFAKPAE